MGSNVSGYKLLYNKKAIEGYLRRRYGVLNQNDNVIKMIDSALLNCPYDINMDSFRMDRLSPCTAIPIQQNRNLNAIPGGVNGKKHKHNKDINRDNNGFGVGGDIGIGHQHGSYNEGTYSLNFVFRSECSSSIRVCANRQDKKGEYICVANWKDYPPGTHTYSTIIQDLSIPLEGNTGPNVGANNDDEKDEIAADDNARRENKEKHRHKGKKNKGKKGFCGDPTKKQAALATTGCILCINVKLIGGQYHNKYSEELIRNRNSRMLKNKDKHHPKKDEDSNDVCLTGREEMKLDPITCVDSCTYFFSLTLDKTKFTATNNVVIPHLAMRKVSHRGCTYLCESIFAASTDMAGGRTMNGSGGTIGNDKKEHALCCICMSECANTLFLPCRHLAMCEECTKEYVNRGSMCCPICREQATSIVEFKK